MRTPLLLLPAFLLTGCAASTASRPPVDPIPASIAAPCANPVILPDRALSDQEVEVFWGRDRTALRSCKSKHAAAVAWPRP